MNIKANKTGRPPKIKIEDKKQIILNYFLFEAQGSVERMSVHNIYALLSAYANKNKYNTQPYDFSRDEDVKRLIQGLELPEKQENSFIPAYISVDIKSLMFKPPEEMMRILIDREEYFKNLHMRAASALDELKSLIDQISSLKDTQNELMQRIKALSSGTDDLRDKDIGLVKENRYLKAYIRRMVEPIIAESIISGKMAFELSKTVSNLIPQKDKEPALVSIPDYIKNDCCIEAETVSAKSILSRIKREVE